MKVVWKFQLPQAGFWRILELPEDAVIVKSSSRVTVMYTWVLLDPDAPKVKRHFGVFPTGQKFDDELVYHDTTFDGSFVWHIAEDVAAKGSEQIEGRDYG